MNGYKLFRPVMLIIFLVLTGLFAGCSARVIYLRGDDKLGILKPGETYTNKADQNMIIMSQKHYEEMTDEMLNAVMRTKP